MDSQDFRDAILSKRPHYANSRIPVFEALANKGNKKSEYNQFGPIYELYIYAFTIGLKKGLNLPLPERKLTKEFNPIGQWKRDSKLVDFLMMIIFTHCDEIGFTWNELEDMEEKELNNVVGNIISFIESYANGGLEFIQQEWQNNNLSIDHYMFVDLMIANSTFKEKVEEGNESLSIDDSDEIVIESTKKLIKQGESPKTEFKSTLRVNMHTKNPDAKMELMCIKTIAGFMNTKGGTLIIGVEDNKAILGIDNDLKSFGNKSDLMDEFQKHLDNLIENYLGNSVYSLIETYFMEIEGKTVCRLDIRFSKTSPVYVKNKSKADQDFYIRRNASTIALKTNEMIGYKENNWR